MKLKMYISLILVTILISSCKNKTEEPTGQPSKKDTINTKVIKAELEDVSQENNHVIMKKLQGEWKEAEYPYRRVIFKKETVKFMEEGMAEDPQFKPYKISNKCPFNVNNIKQHTNRDTILVLVEDERCEKLNISNNTLKLSGFNTATSNDYTILYERVE
ncbi:MAG TPA: hypothetical protein DEG69_10120 [Flavobacteriaceae bacterium]|jgi:hypothetical protein|nr:hypothetical protein [Flavobacteriaceae bacterium]|tara:strand:+ start:12320 stop:12799 length:480 start_codon:yes stop_codon:yes gene_type:complete